MGQINVNLPDSLHQAVRELAQKENISINQLITIALAEKISVLTTETYLQERASKGSRNKFENALNLVPDVDPDDEDKL